MVTVLKFHTPVSDKKTGAVWSGSTLFAIPLSVLINNCINKQTFSKKNDVIF